MSTNIVNDHTSYVIEQNTSTYTTIVTTILTVTTVSISTSDVLIVELLTTSYPVTVHTTIIDDHTSSFTEYRVTTYTTIFLSTIPSISYSFITDVASSSYPYTVRTTVISDHTSIVTDYLPPTVLTTTSIETSIAISTSISNSVETDTLSLTNLVSYIHNELSQKFSTLTGPLGHKRRDSHGYCLISVHY